MALDHMENKIIEHCAPTLAGMKSAGLFSYFYDDRQDAVSQLRQVNLRLNDRGVYVEALLWRDDSVLIYAYRKRQLERELGNPEVKKLLAEYGYIECEVNGCIEHLKKRLCDYVCFPHEIGIFLGYPLDDVVGFIENRGRNCKYCGLWKVYGDECETRRLFAKLEKCTKVYMKVFSEGRTIRQLTVCA